MNEPSEYAQDAGGQPSPGGSSSGIPPSQGLTSQEVGSAFAHGAPVAAGRAAGAWVVPAVSLLVVAAVSAIWVSGALR